MSDHITLPRELVFRAVKVLSPMAYDTWPRERSEVVEDLRDRLAAPAQEPVAVVGTQVDGWKLGGTKWYPPGPPIKVTHMLRDLPEGTLLYAAPPEIEAPRRDVERLTATAFQAQNAAIDLAQRYKRLQGLLLDILNDAQTSHWHRDIDAALQEPPR